ncbi:MAG: DUF6438 domain-containing protein [Bacteroidota bacterium]
MKSITSNVFLLLVTILLLSACKTTQKALTQDQIQALPKVLEFSKSGCRGQCPIFDLTVYEGGWMVFDGRAWTKHEGKATAKLDKEAFAQLQTDCERANLWDKQEKYSMNIMDIPTTTVHLYEKGKDKKVQWRMRAPQELAVLSNQIMEIIYAEGWLERTPKEKGIELPKKAIHNEIIVQLKKGVKPQEWCTKFGRYDLKVKRTLSTLTPIYLLSFDTGKMAPDRMLSILRKDDKVVMAEFNKRLEMKSR